ncbi:MAG TPA: phosphatidylserine decarboxylase, partial [Vicinamibacterales bacterium]|nr:phosphatidylserine decarboxylase [Vicinamibacterales bacterium]
MRIDPAGWPFVLGGLILAIAAAFLAGPVYGWVLLGLSAFFLFFFRDPERVIAAADAAVLSPADGRVMVAGASTAHDFPAASWQQISIFLSPMDVHVNRMPVSGRVIALSYRPGRFINASFDKASEHNERMSARIRPDGRDEADDLAVIQIAGLVARRIKCDLAEGATVERGERYGIIRFGSRLDVYLPPRTRVVAKEGQHVKAGETILAAFSSGVTDRARW